MKLNGERVFRKRSRVGGGDAGGIGGERMSGLKRKILTRPATIGQNSSWADKFGKGDVSVGGGVGAMYRFNSRATLDRRSNVAIANFILCPEVGEGKGDVDFVQEI